MKLMRIVAMFGIRLLIAAIFLVIMVIALEKSRMYFSDCRIMETKIGSTGITLVNNSDKCKNK